MSLTNLPSFLFVGTAKAGTTSIYKYLKQHPDIEIPVKESFYFIDNESTSAKLPYPMQRKQEDITTSIEEYERHYLGIRNDAIVGEIGTGYMYYHEQCIPRIKSTLGDEVRICMILRNPVHRAWSAYSHFAKDLHEPFKFERAIQEESNRTLAHWDFMWHYISLGAYAKQVLAYQKAFKHVKVFLYEDLERNPQQLMNELSDFIGASTFQFDTSQKHNRSANPRSSTLQKLVTHESTFKQIARPIFRALFGKDKRRGIRKFIRERNMEAKALIPTDIKETLLQHYCEDVQQLELLIDRDLGHWTRSK